MKWCRGGNRSFAGMEVLTQLLAKVGEALGWMVDGSRVQGSPRRLASPPGYRIQSSRGLGEI